MRSLTSKGKPRRVKRSGRASGLISHLQHEYPANRDVRIPLAASHDNVGILVYDLDETAAGRAGPVGAFSTEDLPTAVCVKPLPGRQLLVIAGNMEKWSGLDL